MPRLETMKNSNVFLWGEAYIKSYSERPLTLMPSISFNLEPAFVRFIQLKSLRKRTEEEEVRWVRRLTR